MINRDISIIFKMIGILVIPVVLYSQEGFNWYHTFGSSNSEIFSTGILTADGGAILFGVTDHYYQGTKDLLIIKCDADGEEEWRQAFPEELTEVGTDVLQMEDGGYLMVGGKEHHPRGEALLLRLNEEGERVWDRRFGDEAGASFSDVYPLQNGDFVLTGNFGGVRGSGWIMVVNDIGIPSISIRLEDYGIIDAVLTQDEEIILLGADLNVRKLDLEGEEIWSTYIGENRGSYRDYRQIALCSDGGIVIPYGSRRDFQNESIDVIKLDDDGEVVWEQSNRLGQIDTDNLLITEVEEGRLLLASISALFKITAAGELMWGWGVNLDLSDNYRCRSINRLIYDDDGNYRLLGTAVGQRYGDNRDYYGDFMLAKFNTNGEEIESEHYGFMGGNHEAGLDILPYVNENIPDAMYLVLANTMVTPRTNNNPLLMILNEDGDSLSSNLIESDLHQHAYRTFSASDSTWLMVGTGLNQDDIEIWWVSKIDRDLEEIWRREHLQVRYVSLTDMIATEDGGILLIGGKSRYSEGNAVLINNDGALVSSLSGQPGPFVSAVELDNNGFAILSTDCEVLITGEDLEVVDWIDIGVPRENSVPHFLARTIDGDLLALGQTRNTFITRMTLQGERVWTQFFNDLSTYRAKLIASDDGSIYFCQHRRIDKLDELGRVVSEFIPEWHNNNRAAVFNGFLPVEGGDLLCVGEQDGDILTALMDNEAMVTPILPIELLTPSFLNIVAVPNPFNAFTSISYDIGSSGVVKLVLYDIKGGLAMDMYSGYLSAGSYTHNLTASGLTSGVYFIRLTTEHNSLTKKLILIR